MLTSTLLGKTALITGGTKGIGLAIATRFAQEGCSVILASTSASPAHPALKSLPIITSTSSSGPSQQQQQQQQHYALPLNVSSPQEWKSLLSSKTSSSQQIDILVNCAGISLPKLLTSTSEEEISSLIATNLTGAILGCKYVGKSMIASSLMMKRRSSRQKEQEGEDDSFPKISPPPPSSSSSKCIINISSLLATKPTIGSSVYSASKAGLLGLTTSLAREYGAYGIRVNAILPGYIETAMTQGISRERIHKEIPLARLGRPEEVAYAAAFLAKNEYANNCIINLDGGLSA